MASSGYNFTETVSPSTFNAPGQNTILALTFSTLALCILCGVLRLYTRLFITRQPWWDDVCISFVLLCVVAQSILTQIMVNNGLGVYFWNIKPTQLMTLLQANYFSLGFFSLSVGFIKTTLLLQFLRLLNRGSVAYRVALGLQIFVCLWTIAFGFISWFPCFPITKSWDVDRPGRCYGLGVAKDDMSQFLASFLAHASSSLVIDLIIFALAGHLMWKLGTKQPHLRLRLCILLSIGFIVTGSALVRMAFIVITILHNAHEPEHKDPMWAMAVGVTLLNIEVNVATVCASVPIFWLPIQKAVANQWNRIFVTDEVSVTWTARHLESVEYLDRPRKTKHRPTTSGAMSSLQTIPESPHGSSSHYDDEFVQAHVDPFQLEPISSLHTTVSSETSLKKK